MKVVGWQAFYTQNREFSSEDMKWEDLPKEGVLTVIVFMDEFSGDTRLKEVIQGRRRYFLATGSTGNIFIKGSLWDEKKISKTYNVAPTFIKEGIWDDDESYLNSIKKAAKAEFKGVSLEL